MTKQTTEVSEKIFRIYLNLTEDGAAEECDIVTLDEANEDYPFFFPRIESLEINETFSCAHPDEEVGVYQVTRLAESPERI